MIRSISLVLLALLCFQAVVSNEVGSIFPKVPPEANWNFKQLVTHLNYPFEEHHVTTDDGYILTIHRIQAKNTVIKRGLPPIVVNHGLLDSSDSWAVNYEDQCPGYLLANAGFDVWFVNNRGNKYSLGHTNPKYNSNDAGSKFWDFSWQEMSQHDLPASLKYVAQYTGQKVDYVGHSEGTTIMFAALARRDPVVTQVLNKFIALAPAVFLQHSTSPIVQIGGWLHAGKILKAYSGLVNRKKFGFMAGLTRKIYVELCTIALPTCIARVKLLSDADPSVDNVERFKVTSGHFPAGTSVQNVYYWSQMFNNENFPMYDYGKKKNIEIYGTNSPPNYDLSRITEPVYMFVGESDHLASPPDTATLRAKLTGSSRVEYRRYPLGHGSFLWGKNVAGYINDVLAVLHA
jgi:pimeloyl-ACP methyl ester carboxylesterase